MGRPRTSLPSDAHLVTAQGAFPHARKGLTVGGAVVGLAWLVAQIKGCNWPQKNGNIMGISWQNGGLNIKFIGISWDLWWSLAINNRDTLGQSSIKGDIMGIHHQQYDSWVGENGLFPPSYSHVNGKMVVNQWMKWGTQFSIKAIWVVNIGDYDQDT